MKAFLKADVKLNKIPKALRGHLVEPLRQMGSYVHQTEESDDPHKKSSVKLYNSGKTDATDSSIRSQRRVLHALVQSSLIIILLSFRFLA